MPDPPFVLGIDSSTTSCKAIVWSLRGEAVAEGRAPIVLANPVPDAWEQDANDWWRALVAAVRSALRALDREPDCIAALAIANQRETFVLTDEGGEPLVPALVWMDNRCQREVKEAVAALGANELHRITGKPPCTTPSFYKLLFLLRRGSPHVAARRPRLLDVHGFLAWRLTGRFATSLASADPTGLVDLEKRGWSETIVDWIGFDRSQLPELVRPGARLGEVSASAAEATGLPKGLPVIAGAGDGQAAGLGAGIVDGSRAYLNLGTAIVSGVLSDRYVTDSSFRTLFGASDSFFLETDLKGGTFIVTWLVEKLLGCSPAEASTTLRHLEEQARQLPPGADGLMLVPYWNAVMNPYWDDDATGLLLGCRGGHGASHVYRSILEGIAFEQRVHTEGVETALGTTIERFVVMGGGSASDLWCQILADVLGKPIARTASQEATSLGAAMLAAVGAGLHRTADHAVNAMTRSLAPFEPSRAATFYDRAYREVYRGLYPAMRHAMSRLAELRS